PADATSAWSIVRSLHSDNEYMPTIMCRTCRNVQWLSRSEIASEIDTIEIETTRIEPTEI
ncbi:MAG: hypothetical protein J2O49_04890, partial [Sciscionella sp.]|nr:hypothetical protein [Sciscionella sp.]